MKPKCFCQEMANGELCDHCERERYFERQEQAIEQVMEGNF